jgi:hypothetical protein
LAGKDLTTKAGVKSLSFNFVNQAYPDRPDVLFFRRALIKLLTKMIIAISDVIIITNTLAIPRLSDLPMAPISGFRRPRSIRSVRTTAIWARTWFPFLYPGVIPIRIIPAITGMRAVTEGVSDEKYAQLPMEINTIAFRKFIKYGFTIIISYSNNE